MDQFEIPTAGAFDTGDALIDGMATLCCDAGCYLNGDVGGADGWQVADCTLVQIEVDGLLAPLPRTLITRIFGEDAVRRFEAGAARQIEAREVAA